MITNAEQYDFSHVCLNLAMLDNVSHLVSLFEYATEGFVVTGPDGNIILVNPSACRMFGYAAEELLGQKIEILIPGTLRKDHIGMRKAFYEDPANRVMGHGRDLRAQRSDGTQFPVEVSLSTYMHGDDRYVTAFIVDISHRKQIEANMLNQQKQLEKVSGELKHLNTELEVKVEERTIILKEALQQLEESRLELSQALEKEKQLSEIKSRFVSMASHEFRTPLSTILSSAALSLKYVNTGEQSQRQRHITKIRDSVKHLNDLLEDFLSLGKLDEGKVNTSIAAFDIRKVSEDTIDDIKGLLKEGQVIKYQHHGSELINSDKNLIRNMLINIISNAIKFSAPDAELNIETSIKNNKAVIIVKDQGIGISQEDMGHLFSSFFRGKNAQNIQGTGLGLHIVKRYVDLLHGDIQVKSELDRGTAFTITIPANL